MSQRIVVPMILAALVCVAGWTVNASSQERAPASQAWEYQEVQLSARVEATPTLNRMGAQGWELVGVTSACTGTQCTYWAYFKRPK